MSPRLKFRILSGLFGLALCAAAGAQVCSVAQLQVDVHNCGTCGLSCYANTVHTLQACNSGQCAFQGCEAGYYDLNADQACEYACNFVSSQELCNGVDDNCNGQIDEGVVAPTPVQVCGVSPAATGPECTTGVATTCVNGNWQCSFPAAVCNPTCAAASEICDSVDNNCNGLLNENISNFGGACASDDGVAGGHGRCRATGTIQCDGPNAGICNAVKADCATLPNGCTEFCDGEDNDCDGLTDEDYQAKGANSVNFVRPAVTRISPTRWMYSYEASRPSAAVGTQGNGNGWATSAPIGTTIDKTPACSEPGRLPWTNLTAVEAEQVCAAMGGALCTTSEYQTACQPSASCQWGYAPRGGAGSACATPYSAGKFCNLQPSYDFSSGAGGDQDGLLTSGDPALQNCHADWSALQGNGVLDDKIHDLTGNVREYTSNGIGDYRLMGGAYDHRIDSGATCSFNLFRVDQDFRYQDSGFRCCFSVDPRL